MNILTETPQQVYSVEQKLEPERDSNLDLLRGIMLIVMTIDHNGGPLKQVFYETLGFVTAAEGFVYLSGIVFGLVYSKRLAKGFSCIFNAALKRSAVIYFYHLLLIAILTMPIWANLLSAQAISNSIFLAPFSENYPLKLFLYTVFLYQPHLMDILPMYCIYIFLAPFVLNLFSKNKQLIFFILSGALWLVSQLDIYQLAYPELGIDMGSFNIFAWQFLFFSGVFIGHLRFKGISILPVNKLLFIAASTLALIFFVVNLLFNFEYIDLPDLLIGKPNLGIFRIINFFLIAYSIHYLIKSKIFFKSQWISFLGKHSLQVFIFHIFCAYFIDFVRHRLGLEYAITDIVFSFIAVALLLIPAYLHQYAQKKFPVVKRLGL